MKKLLMAATAGVMLLSAGANAADKRPPKTAWRIYNFTDQNCQDIGSPLDVMAMIRRMYHTAPIANDVVEGGVVTGTAIEFNDQEGHVLIAHMFRYAEDCEAYAGSLRGDTSKYN